MQTRPAGWEDIFDDDETIVWQGRPDTVVVWSNLLSFESIFGLVFAGFAVFWLSNVLPMLGIGSGVFGSAFARHSGPPLIFSLIFPTVGIAFVFIGLYMVIGRLFWDAYLRGRTWYTLSTRAAYIATEVWGKRRLKRYSLASMSTLDLEDGSPGTVWFAEEIQTYRSRRAGGRTSRTRTRRVPIGFRRITEPRAVLRLISEARDARQAATIAPHES
jgi:hypothetical protein